MCWLIYHIHWSSLLLNLILWTMNTFTTSFKPNIEWCSSPKHWWCVLWYVRDDIYIKSDWVMLTHWGHGLQRLVPTRAHSLSAATSLVAEQLEPDHTHSSTELCRQISTRAASSTTTTKMSLLKAFRSMDFIFCGSFTEWLKSWKIISSTIWSSERKINNR